MEEVKWVADRFDVTSPSSHSSLSRADCPGLAFFSQPWLHTPIPFAVVLGLCTSFWEHFICLWEQRSERSWFVTSWTRCRSSAVRPQPSRSQGRGSRRGWGGVGGLGSWQQRAWFGLMWNRSVFGILLVWWELQLLISFWLDLPH